MGHNFTERDGMFTVREPAWHGLQTQVFDDYPTREQAQAIAHPWEPVAEPLYRMVPVIGDDGELGECFELVEGHVLNARSDTGASLGVVSDTYEPVLNRTMYDLAEALEGEAKGDVRFETGGSLKGGSKVWLLLRLQEPLKIGHGPNSEVIPYFALQNAHDGSGSFRGQATVTRIVCDNTAQLADMESRSRGTEFVFSHTKNVHDRIEEAKQALAGWRASVENYRLFMETMAATPITKEQRRQYVDRFIPMPLSSVVSERVIGNVEKSRDAFWDIVNGPTMEGIGLTAQGLIEASIEYLNHGRRAHNEETRFRRNYLDRNRVVTDATNIVRELVGV